jgi:hypothetical protein
MVPSPSRINVATCALARAWKRFRGSAIFFEGAPFGVDEIVVWPIPLSGELVILLMGNPGGHSHRRSDVAGDGQVNQRSKIYNQSSTAAALIPAM